MKSGMDQHEAEKAQVGEKLGVIDTQESLSEDKLCP
jgi:hypothetical protein